MSWFGHDAAWLARTLDLPRVEAMATVGSTMDTAHTLASAGAPGGTLVLAEEQTGGRGRSGKRWSSAPRAGIWATLVERPRDASGLDVLSLRVGLRLSGVLERWSEEEIRLKWPNDLFVAGRKLAGVLIEARWRDERPDWVAIGIGINLRVPDDQREATALRGAEPVEVLGEVLPALRAAAFASGSLGADELAAFARRDLAHGRQLREPAEGTARGITADGALLIESGGALTPWRSGSLVLSS